MKTINEIKNDIALEHGYAGSMDVFEFSYALCDEVAKRYATEAIKTDRERVAECAYMKYHCGHFKTNTPTQHHQIGGDNIQIDKESILNLPIELP